ncbi:hypothetical protein EXIGLDRAFT_649508, partial [Exidia glandulosa HHB12029]
MSSGAGAFASLAHVRILVLPLGGISKSTFDACAELVRSIDSVRLVDIPADPREDKARFMPAPLAAGSIQLSYVAHPPPASHAPLAVFRPSLFPLGVIGIASVPGKLSPAELVPHLNASIARVFPDEHAPFPLARTCLAFESEETDVHDSPQTKGCTVIPAVMGNKKLYIGQLLADLCSNIIGEFTGLYQLLETQHGMDMIAAQALPSFPSPSATLPTNLNRNSVPYSDSPRQSLDLASTPESRRSSFQRPRTTSIPHSNSQPHITHKGPTSPPLIKRSSTQVGTLKQQRRATSMLLPNGRLYKVLGDLYLLSGQLDQANVWYTTAQNMFKSAGDMVWHASVLEGLCTVAVLEAYSALETGSEAASTGDKEPWAHINDKMSMAISLYSRASPSSMLTDVEYSLFSLLLSDSVLRHTNFLFAIWSSKGWGPAALSHMVRPTLPAVFASRPVPEAHLLTLDAESKVTRSHIASTLAQAHGAFLVHLRPHDKIRVLSAVAATFSLLGYRRKEVYILRELLCVLMDMIVCGREETARASAVTSPVSGGGAVSPVANGRPRTPNGVGSPVPQQPQQQVTVRAHESTAGNTSILAIVRQICDIYGVPLDSISIVDDPNTTEPTSGVDAPRQVHFGWPELQVGSVKEVMAIVQALPDYLALAQMAHSALKTLQPVMEIRDHRHLYDTAMHALTTAKRRGDERRLSYWADNPVVAIQVILLPFERTPIQHSTRDLLPPSEEDTSAVVVGRKDPFLYNPRLKKASTAQALAVQGEAVELDVTLYNPYTFHLEVQELSLSTTGVTFESQPLNVVLAPLSFDMARIVVTPPEAGMVYVRGCVARVPGSVRKEFFLPVLTDEEKEKSEKRHSMQALELGRHKRSGLQARSRLSGTAASSAAPVHKFMEIKIVPAQPLLKIRRTSLTRSALTLYSGETVTIRLTLENVSNIDVDFMKVTFDDSTIGPAQGALADGELSVFDTYETEYELIHQPVFTWAAPESEKTIAAGKRVALSVNCFGKIGCTNGTIQISYGLTKPVLEAGVNSFYVRQMLYEVDVTVYNTLECSGMDILPLSSFDVHDRENISDANLQLIADVAASVDEDDWCLFTIDVRNCYGLPFDVIFERSQEETPSCQATKRIAPGSTSRILLPVKRVLLPESVTSKPIPTLSDRQFVVSKDKLSSAETAAQLELFWYREELFKTVQARWQEAGNSRFGELSLRQQRMTMRMLHAFKIPPVKVHLSFVSSPVVQNPSSSRRRTVCPPNDFVTLRVEVKNTSRAPQVLALSLALSPADYVLSDGILSDIPLGRIESGATGSIDVGLCFVSSGNFDVVAEARRISGPQSYGFETAGLGELRVSVQDEQPVGAG